MKRQILTALMVATGLWLAAGAQNVVADSLQGGATVEQPDSTGHGSVSGDKVRHSKSRGGASNVLGAPIYYDSNGYVRGSAHGDEEPQLPRRHYLNDDEETFCSIFLELEGMLGADDMAGGFNLTVLPNRWGAYTSAMFGFGSNYFSLGPALRLSDSHSSLDWHLYGGLVFAERHLGAECGLRMAMPRTLTDFCWMSMSIGMVCVNGDVGMTLGVSLPLMVSSIWLW